MSAIITTYSGVELDLASPCTRMVNGMDIAHALAHLCRFTGHTSQFYSVAEHSVFVSHLVPNKLALQALLHDAAEAYVGDMSTPLKGIIPEFKAVEERVWSVVAKRFNVPEQLDPAVKEADWEAYKVERAKFFLPHTGNGTHRATGASIVGLPPDRAKMLFMARLSTLRMR